MELSNILYYSLYENSIYIYVIRQECGKYFIGKTNTPNITITDIQELAKKTNQKWLLNFRTVKIQELIHSLDAWDEDKITLKYMDKYGINNVRGGSFNSINLSVEELTTIRAMIASAKGECQICKVIGHSKPNCPMLLEFQDYEVIVKDQNEVLITTPASQDPSQNEIKSSASAGILTTETVKYFSNAITSATETTRNVWKSLFGAAGLSSSPTKCLRCGYGGHKTGQCINEIKITDDSLMFPDNKIYNPIFKSS